MNNNQFRKSKQKDAILRVLNDTKCHPSADWVYEQVKKEIPNISLGTVYRNLKLLKENGNIRELDFTGEQSRYDGNIKGHYHFRCVKCGCILDIDEPVDSAVEQRVARKMGVKVTGHNLEIVGLCRHCR